MANVTCKATFPCAQCGTDMELCFGKYGLFYGCIAFPECRHTIDAYPDGHPKDATGESVLCNA